MEPFAGANNFSLIVAGDANLGSGVRVQGGGLIGGNVSMNGSNSAFGQQLPAGSLGLYVGGNLSGNSGNKQVAMFNTDYYVEGTIGNIRFQNPGSNVGADPFAFLSIGSALSAKSSELAAQTAVGATINAADLNNVKISVTPGMTNVLNLNSSNAAFLSNQNSNIQFLNMTSDTKLIINYALGSGLIFKAKNQSLSSALFGNVIWNFTGGANLTFANSVSSFKGNILAAESYVDWQANNLDGQLLAGSLKWAHTSQNNYNQPWSPWVDEKPPVSEVPEPSSWILLGVGLLLVWVSRSRQGALRFGKA